MPRLRDLSIATKLGLSALFAVLFLGALAWAVQDSMARVAAAEQASAAAQEAMAKAQEARRISYAIRIASRDMQFAQRAPTVQATMSGVAQQAAEAGSILQGLVTAEADPATKALLSKAEASLAAYAAALGRAAAMRGAMIETREKGFFPLSKPFNKALDGVRASLAAEDIPYAELAPLRSALEDYASAISTMRAVTLKFLASGDRSEELSLKDSAGNAEVAIKSLLASPISDSLKDEVRALQKLGSDMQRAATGLFAAAGELDAYVEDKAEAAGRTMHNAIAEAIRQFAGRATAAQAEANAAMAEARQRTLWISAGIALLMLASGLLTARGVSRPIRAMTQAVQAMAAGETGAAISWENRGDEIGRMAAALEKLRGAVRQAFVQGQMIEQIPVGVITAEVGSWRIGYANPELVRMIERVREHVPIAPDQLVGQSLGFFHRNEAGVEAILGDPDRLPYRTHVHLGGEVFELCASALRDREGKYVGPMVTWTVLTGRMRLSERFEKTVGAIAAAVGEHAAMMTETAHAMSEAAAESGRSSTAVAGASDQAASNVQSVAASAEELAASVTEISRQVAESARIAGQAVREAEQTDACVHHLSQAATRIGDVVKLINDIAGRTNLLALNATIEAARAGDAGKGFAVVASEVKTLATQTARATEEIGAQIAAMQGEVGQAVSALRSIGDTIQRMNEIATAIAGAVEQQGATTQEIARAVQHAAAGTAEVHSNISLVSQVVAHTGEQAQAVLEAARTLTAQSETLKAEVGSFLTAVREAA